VEITGKFSTAFTLNTRLLLGKDKATLGRLFTTATSYTECSPPSSKLGSRCARVPTITATKNRWICGIGRFSFTEKGSTFSIGSWYLLISIVLTRLSKLIWTAQQTLMKLSTWLTRRGTPAAYTATYLTLSSSMELMMTFRRSTISMSCCSNSASSSFSASLFSDSAQPSTAFHQSSWFMFVRQRVTWRGERRRVPSHIMQSAHGRYGWVPGLRCS